MQIIPSVYQLTIKGLNTFLILEEEITLIDTGVRGSGLAIGRTVKNLGRSIEEVSLIIITHNHLDHIGGLKGLRKFTPAKVAIHSNDLGFKQKGLPYHGLLKAIMKTPFMPAIWPFMYVTEKDVDIVLQGGEMLKPLGGLEVVHTPGHTPGGICLYSAKKKILIAGDTISYRNRDFFMAPKLVNSDNAQLKQSVKQLAQLDFDILCYGHGKPLKGNASAKLKDWLKRKGL
jgi:glyoxylase-like metal-dependent hydrolase (beta-lactamase superfamily II)